MKLSNWNRYGIAALKKALKDKFPGSIFTDAKEAFPLNDVIEKDEVAIYHYRLGDKLLRTGKTAMEQIVTLKHIPSHIIVRHGNEFRLYQLSKSARDVIAFAKESVKATR